jgi:hypothetical protein
MKVVRIRYGDTPALVVADARRFFRDDTITMASLRRDGAVLLEKKRFGIIKEKFNELGSRTKIILIILVRDTFIMPLWIQGVVIQVNDLTDPIDHHWLGHEIPVPDDPTETPEEAIL